MGMRHGPVPIAGLDFEGANERPGPIGFQPVLQHPNAQVVLAGGQRQLAYPAFELSDSVQFERASRVVAVTYDQRVALRVVDRKADRHLAMCGPIPALVAKHERRAAAARQSRYEGAL